jgi:hypothetical protein
MATAVTGTIKVIAQLLLQNTIGLQPASAVLDRTLIDTFTSGAGLGAINRLYTESDKSLSAAYDLDLAGSLTDALGAACVFARVKVLLAWAPSTNTANVEIGGDAAAALFGFKDPTDIVVVRPGGKVLIVAPDATGYAVTAVTADILQFAPSAGTQLISFAIGGAAS